MSRRIYVPEGSKFGRLTVLENLPTRAGKAMCRCKCECGKVIDVKTTPLRHGMTKSCGCLNLDHARAMNRKHGDYKSRLYNTWLSMNSRCSWPGHPSYKNYGGRGIRVCVAWRNPHGYGAFKKWALANGYSDDLTIERKDVNKGYSPANCTWVTHAVQARNLRKTIRVTTEAGEMCLAAAARYYNVVTPKQAHNRVYHHGWTPLEAVSTPIEAKPHKVDKENNGL